MNRVLCSTGALIGMPNGRNHKLIEKFAKNLECDGFEFMMYSTWYDKVDEIITDLKKMSLDFPVMHCDKRIAEKLATGNTEDLSKALTEFEINCQIANEINAKKMVFHLWNGIISDRHIENNLIAYADLIPIAEKHNIDLMIENVVCNHENPMQHWIELAKNYPDIHFIFDTKMAAFHNQIEQIYDKKYDWFWKEKRIEHLHVNDYAGGYMEWENLKTLPLGSGKINFKKFFTFLKEKNYRGDFTVEATAFLADGNVDYNMLNKCFADIKEYLK